MNKKIGRNDPCPYGGGKKYKNVVLTKIQIQTGVRPFINNNISIKNL